MRYEYLFHYLDKVEYLHCQRCDYFLESITASNKKYLKNVVIPAIDKDINHYQQKANLEIERLLKELNEKCNKTRQT